LKYKKIGLSLFLFLILQVVNFGQIEWTEHWGGRVGATIQFGQPVNRIGIVANVFYKYDFGQLNLEWRGNYNFLSYGPPMKGWESQLTTGVLFSTGEKKEKEIPFVMPFLQQTRRKYAIGYALHFYNDQIETTQRSGTVSLQFNQFHVIVENDAFGSFKGGDEFRTGAFSFLYQYENWMYELKSVLWTGVTSGAGTTTFRDTDYPCRFGYRDICGAKYGRYSHGVLAGQVQRVLDYGQAIQLGVGVDSERVRNFLQNKVIHDMYFFPPKWTKVRNLHIPMLDINGDAYTYQKDQKLKPAAWYLNVALNGSRFY